MRAVERREGRWPGVTVSVSIIWTVIDKVVVDSRSNSARSDHITGSVLDIPSSVSIVMIIVLTVVTNPVRSGIEMG